MVMEKYQTEKSHPKTKKMKFKIITFGCKLNQAESERISASLVYQGFALDSHPDFFIVNACAVTHKAVRESRQKISQLKRKYPQAKIIVTGCLADKKWNGVDLWVANQNKEDMLNKLKYLFPKVPKMAGAKDIKQNNLCQKNRAFIKVQTGCNNFCTYCIVPFLRGGPVSLTATKIIQEIKQKEFQNFKEIVLTGVNIGLYRLGLPNLLKKILKQTTISRIRLGSLWPTHITDDLIRIYSEDSRLCPHFHLSIQSGSNRILKLMARNYTRAQIFKIIRQCRRKIPNINFSADIIVGFPGENNKDFKDSCQLVKDIGFSKVHVFKYSARPGTKAAAMSDQIDEKTKKQRSQALIELADKVAKKIVKKFQNKKLPVLWEDKKNGYWYGYTDNYIRVKKKANSNENLKNTITF